jgi:MFS family permease
MSPTFRSLRIRNYRLFASGMVVSNTGTWMQRVAQDWLVLQLTGGSGVALGITTGLQFLPMLLFGLWGGVLADRYPKRRVLAATSLFMAGTATVLGVLDVTGVVQAWHVFLLAFLLGVGTAVDNPARQSFVVEMVGRDDLPNAVGLNSASFNAARVVGPALAGLLINLFGTGPVFLVNAVTFLAVLLALRGMRAEELAPAPRVPRRRGQIAEGLRYVRGRPDLLLVIGIVFFVGTFGLNFQITTALMATEVFSRGAGSYGLLGSAMAVGSLAGALFAARRERPRLRLVITAAVVFGVLEIAVGLMPTYLTFMFALPFVGAAALTVITAANATVQLAADPAVRGRVTALYTAVFFGGTPLGAPLVGVVAEAFGARWSLIGGGSVSAAATVVLAGLLMRSKGLAVRPRIRPRPHLQIQGAGRSARRAAGAVTG